MPTGICKIQAGEWPSTVASQAVLEGTIECLPGEDIHQDQGADFKASTSSNGRQKDPWFQNHPLQIEWFGLWFDAAEIDPNHPMVHSLKAAAKSVTGREAQVDGAGGCDSAFAGALREHAIRAFRSLWRHDP